MKAVKFQMTVDAETARLIPAPRPRQHSYVRHEPLHWVFDIRRGSRLLDRQHHHERRVEFNGDHLTMNATTTGICMKSARDRGGSLLAGATTPC